MTKNVVLAKTLLTATLGGVLFYALHVPLAWMLGPLVFVVISAQVLRRPVYFAMWVRNGSLVVLGYVIGRSFTMEAARQISSQLPVMLLVTLSILAISLLLGYYTHRRTGISLSTSLMGSVPGGFSQMVLMSEEIENTDVTVVSFMHTIRLLSVIVIVPYLATQAAATVGIVPASQVASATTAPFFAPLPLAALPLLAWSLAVAWIADKTHWPTPYLLGPIFGAALAAMAGLDCPSLPAWLTILCQIAVGTYMGMQIELKNLANWRILLAYTLLGTVLVIAACLGTAQLLSHYYGYSNVTSFLSMAPGGIAEMSVTGIALQAELSVIASYQMFRLFFLILITPVMFRKMLKNR